MLQNGIMLAFNIVVQKFYAERIIGEKSEVLQ
jgi:hypothetical protein